MKNQYFSDVNDFRKYGLLRSLLADDKLTAIVAWMLTPDDGSRDGGKREYLQCPERWRHYDPTLYSGLAELLDAASSPNVALLEESNLLPRTQYYSRLSALHLQAQHFGFHREAFHVFG